jgi:copper chaperone CopZ
MLVQMEVGALPGVAEVKADHRLAVAEVTYDPEAVGPDDIVGAVLKAGYGAEPLES